MTFQSNKKEILVILEPPIARMGPIKQMMLSVNLTSSWRELPTSQSKWMLPFTWLQSLLVVLASYCGMTNETFLETKKWRPNLASLWFWWAWKSGFVVGRDTP